MEITVCPAFLKATEQEWDRNGKKDCPAFWRRQCKSRNGARMEQEWKDGVSSLVKATGQEQEWDRNGKKDCPAFWRRHGENRNGTGMERRVVQPFEGDRARAGTERRVAQSFLKVMWQEQE